MKTHSKMQLCSRLKKILMIFTINQFFRVSLIKGSAYETIVNSHIVYIYWLAKSRLHHRSVLQSDRKSRGLLNRRLPVAKASVKYFNGGLFVIWFEILGKKWKDGRSGEKFGPNYMVVILDASSIFIGFLLGTSK